VLGHLADPNLGVHKFVETSHDHDTVNKGNVDTSNTTTEGIPENIEDVHSNDTRNQPLLDDTNNPYKDADITKVVAPSCEDPMEEECNTKLIYGPEPKENLFVNECCCVNHKEKIMLGCALFSIQKKKEDEA